uniref:7-ethoxycoumarin O-deethylase n=1 Tax=Aegilops tauschii TaxID=37682 RepID=M8C0A3_AEGTA
MDHVARLARDGKPVNVGRVAFTTSLNLLSRTIFSHDLTNLDDDNRSGEFQEVVTGIMDEAVGTPNVSDFFPMLAPADLQGTRRRLARLFARLHVVFDAEFKWSLPIELERDGIDMEDKFGLTLTKVVPLRIVATPV